MGHYTDAPKDNLLGLTDRRLLDEAEAEAVIRGESFLYDLPEEADFTVSLLLDLHRAVFGRVYEWTGQYRRSNPKVGSYPTCRRLFSRYPLCYISSRMKCSTGSGWCNLKQRW